jgi:hypothetical protein
MARVHTPSANSFSVKLVDWLSTSSNTALMAVVLIAFILDYS